MPDKEWPGRTPAGKWKDVEEKVDGPNLDWLGRFLRFRLKVPADRIWHVRRALKLAGVVVGTILVVAVIVAILT